MLPATTKNLRSFGLAMGGAFSVLAVLVLWRSGSEHRVTFTAALFAVGAVMATLGLTAPGKLVYLYKPWMGFAHYMGIVMTHVLMTVMYFTFLAPFALIRLKDPLRLRMGGSTYWEPYRNPEQTLERFQRPF